MGDRVVVLQTCDRLAETRRTLETFRAFHPPGAGVTCWHVDDGSADPAPLDALVGAFGFETIVRQATRRGPWTTRRDGILALARRGVAAVCWLENDWTWLGPIPWSTWDARPADVYTLRLYGAFKGPDRTIPCQTVDLGRGRAPVTWAPAPGLPGVELARIHWGAPPAITTVDALVRIHAAAGGPGYDPRSEAGAFRASAAEGTVARLVENVVVHHGAAPTPRPAAGPAARPARYSTDWHRGRSRYAPGAAACLEAAFDRYGVPGSLLDVGCGLGHLVDRARALGVDAVGVDVALAGDAGPLRYADLTLPLDLGRRFDLVLCWEVAEHLPPAAAAVLVDSLVRHLAPGGRLLFTAAVPGQGGDGHLNERPAPWWGDRFRAAGLTPDPAGVVLAARWRAVAPATPWYGANLQAWRCPGAASTFHGEHLPTLSVTMRTADRGRPTPGRTLGGGPNYLAGTLDRLHADGADPRLLLCASHPDTAWLDPAVDPWRSRLRLDVPTVARTANENGLAQVRAGLTRDPQADWILILEDDLAFCADFLGSVRRWLAAVDRPDRSVYRLFGFRVRPTRGALAYDDPSILTGLCGTQAVALRRADAADFLTWATANLAAWGAARGNVALAFDKLIGSWSRARWPGRPAVMASPMLVAHLGDISSLHRRAIRYDQYFAGVDYVTPRPPRREAVAG